MPTTDWPDPDDEAEEEAAEDYDASVEDDGGEDSIEDPPPDLEHVDSRRRAEAARFERESEAELAAGMLRANGIAAEIAPLIIPGLGHQLSLWVPRDQESLARQLLKEAEEGDFRE